MAQYQGLFSSTEPTIEGNELAGNVGASNYSGVGSGTAQPAPQSSGMGIGDWLGKIGLLLSATAGGARGDYGVVQRAMLMEESEKQRQQLAQRQERQAKMEEERIKLARAGMIPELFKMIQGARDIIDTPEAADKVAGIIEPMGRAAGLEYSKGTYAELLQNKGDIDAAIEMIPELEGLPPAKVRALMKSETAFKAHVANYREQRGTAVFDLLLKNKDKEVKDDQGKVTKWSDLPYATFVTEIPDTKYLSDDKLAQLNQAGFKGFKTKSIIEAEEKGKIETAASQAAGERQDKAIEAADVRQQRGLDVAAAREARLTGQFQQTIALGERREERMNEQQRRLLPSQQKILTGNKQAIKVINDYEKAYDEFIAESKGATLSDILRGGIAKNATAQRAQDLVTVEGRTPAERKLAAQYNSMVGSVRSLTDEVGVLTDRDVPRIMGSFNPAQDRKQVKENLAARRRIHQRALDSALEDYQAIGKDISGFVKQRESSSGGELTADMAAQILKEAGGDKAKAREIAKGRGYKF